MTSHPSSNRLLTIAEACRKLSVGRTTVYQLIAEKKISVLKIGSRSLIAEAELDRFIGELTASAA